MPNTSPNKPGGGVQQKPGGGQKPGPNPGSSKPDQGQQGGGGSQPSR